MERVQGIGGVFFRSADTEALGAWYRDMLGLDVLPWGGAVFRWREQHAPELASTVWCPFKADTEYFGDPGQDAMINFRVRDLDAMLAQLRAAGANVVDALEEIPQGRFGWVVDPEGNKIELWEPPADGDPPE